MIEIHAIRPTLFPFRFSSTNSVLFLRAPMIMHKSASSEKILLLHARLRHRRESILVPDLNARLVFVAAGYSQIKYTSLNQPELVLEVPSEYTLRWLKIGPRSTSTSVPFTDYLFINLVSFSSIPFYLFFFSFSLQLVCFSLQSCFFFYSQSSINIC